MDKHTPGPWRVMAPNMHGEIDITAPDTDAPADDPWQVATVAGSCGYPDDQSPANARLIAAAPELLTALRPFADIARVMGGSPPHGTGDSLHEWHLVGGTCALRHSDCVKALEIIAKAEGRQSTSMEGGEG